MEAQIEIKLQPFKVPNYVLVEEDPKPREEGFTEGRKFELKELTAKTLDELCQDFRTAVFKQAGKTDLKE